MNNALHILQFSLGEHELSCDILQIKKILPMMRLEEIAKVSDSVIGLMNLGEQMIPVFDMASCLQMSCLPYSEDTSILLTEFDNQSVGFIVDSVQDLFLTQPERIQKQMIFDGHNLFYRGSILINDKPCLIIELEKLAKHVFLAHAQ